MALPLDPDAEIQATGYRCAGTQLAACGHRLERGQILVELTTGAAGLATIG